MPRAEPGRMLAHYRLVEKIGEGGMGVVWKALDTKLNRHVALKLLPSELTGDPERRRRFLREARTAAAVTHPNIVTIHEVGEVDGVTFLCMELVEGRALRSVIGGRPMPIPQALRVAAEIAEGLARAHEQGIVHRDLKPENVLLGADGHPKILDFGLAKLVEQRHEAVRSQLSQQETRTVELTAEGAIVGTVAYMSPEQARGESVDARTDIFSFGVMLYEMVTGRHPFKGKTQLETVAAILHQPAPSALGLNREIPAHLDELLGKCLEKGPGERYQTSRDLGVDLKRLAKALASETKPSYEPVPNPRPSPRRPWKLMLQSLSGGGAEAAPTGRQASHAAATRLRLVLGGILIGALAVTVLVFVTGRRVSHVQPTFRKLSFGKGWVTSARFTPDGNSVIYSARWDAGDLEGYTTRIDAPGLTPLGIRGIGTVVGVRGGEVAVMVSPFQPGVQSARTLATIPLSGGGPRPVMDSVLTADWSTDGRTFAVVKAVPGGQRLECPPGKALFETAGSIGVPRISPDGARVAFAHYPATGDIAGSVMVVGAKERASTLSEGWKGIQSLAWSRDGSEVWFSAGEYWGWYSIRAVNLRGECRTVFSAPVSLAVDEVFKDGRVLLRSGTITNEMWGRGPGDAGERAYSWLDGTGAFGISADGRSLLFSEISVGGGLTASVYFRRLDGSPPVRIGEGRARGLSPDGAWALATLRQPTPALLLIPTGAGQTRTLPAGSIVRYHWASFFPDGRTVLIVGNEAGRLRRLYVQDLSDGPPRAISREGVWVPEPSACVSPDAARVAAIEDDRPVFVDVASGETRPIDGLLPGDRPLGWTRDGSALFVAQAEPERRDSAARPVLRVVRFDLATRRWTLWKEFQPSDPAGANVVYPPVIARDGEVYFYTVFRGLANLYLADGLK